MAAAASSGQAGVLRRLLAALLWKERFEWIVEAVCRIECSIFQMSDDYLISSLTSRTKIPQTTAWPSTRISTSTSLSTVHLASTGDIKTMLDHPTSYIPHSTTATSQRPEWLSTSASALSNSLNPTWSYHYRYCFVPDPSESFEYLCIELCKHSSPNPILVFT